MLDSPPNADRPAEIAPFATGPSRGGTSTRPGELRETINIRALFGILRRHKAPFLLCLLGLPLCALTAISQITPRYTATGMLVYETNEYKARELQSMVRSDPVTEAVMATQAEILQSLHIAQRVLERRQLASNPEFNRALRPPPVWQAILPWAFAAPNAAALDDQMPGPRLDSARNAALLAVQAALHARPIRFSHAIEVTFTAQDPVLAAAAVNDAMDVYVKDQFGAKARMVRNATALLRKQANELRQETRKSEDAIAAYRARHRLFQGMHAGADAEQISHLMEDLVRARGDLAGADARLDAARGRAGAASLAAIAPSVVQLRVQHDQLAAQAQGQQGRLGENHPVSEGLRRQTVDAQRAIAAETTRVISATEAERYAASDRVATLEQNLRAAQEEADRGAVAQIPLNAMVRDAEASRTELQAVLERIQQTSQQGAIETAEAHEISQALPPEYPSAPRAAAMLTAGTAAGLVLGLVMVYLLHLADSAVNSGDDARAITALPCFALLPEVGNRARGGVPIDDFVIRRPHSAFAEQIRSLRTGLWLSARRPRIIAITAARPSEGKTVLTLALGRSAQRGGERVLLIECDMRQPKFARLLSMTGMVGLAEFLKGEATLADVLHQDPSSGLTFIPAGKPSNDALDLFLSNAMRALLDELRDRYDLILLDAPPAQAISEARVIAAIADATLLCVRWRQTPRAALRHAFDLLQSAQAHIIGTVLTRVDPRAHLRSGYEDAAVYHRRFKPYYRG